MLIFLGNIKDVKIDFLDLIKLSHTDIEKFRIELKVQALKAAEKKAETLLIAVGSKKGKPILIQEIAPTFSYPAMRNGNSNVMNYFQEEKFESDSDVPLKKINLRFEILARFEIE